MLTLQRKLDSNTKGTSANSMASIPPAPPLSRDSPYIASLTDLGPSFGSTYSTKSRGLVSSK